MVSPSNTVKQPAIIFCSILPSYNIPSAAQRSNTILTVVPMAFRKPNATTVLISHTIT